MGKQGKARQILTPLLGSVEFGEEEILTAVTGLFGFEKLKEFLLLAPPEIKPLKCLQSIEAPEVCFAVIDPHYLLPEYKAEVTEDQVANLEIEELKQVKELVIVTIPPRKTEKMTANLLAPIVVNFANRKFKQVVLAASGYSTRHSILELLEQRS